MQLLPCDPAGSQPPSGMQMQTHQGQGPGDQSWQMQHAGFSNNSAANLAGQRPTGKHKCFTIGINCEPCMSPAVCAQHGSPPGSIVASWKCT